MRITKKKSGTLAEDLLIQSVGVNKAKEGNGYTFMIKANKKREEVRRRGRPPVLPSKRTRPVGASVTPHEERTIRARGRGSFTRGVRFLLDYWKSTN